MKWNIYIDFIDNKKLLKLKKKNVLTEYGNYKNNNYYSVLKKETAAHVVLLCFVENLHTLTVNIGTVKFPSNPLQKLNIITKSMC